MDKPDQLICAKKDNPIVIGLGKNENFVASDITALIEYTRDVVFMEDNCYLVMKKDSIEIKDIHGEPVEYSVSTVEWDADAAQKGGYAHFMMKEMFEEPSAFDATVRPRIQDERIYLEHIPVDKDFLAGINNIRTKSLGSNNKQNVVLATIAGLSELKTPEEVARLRGKSVEEILG